MPSGSPRRKTTATRSPGAKGVRRHPLQSRPAKESWAILTKAGLPRYAEVIVYADDPGEAAVNHFILKLMGYPDVKVLLL